MGLSFCRCHGQLSKACVLNLSCDYFNQSCLAKGKIAPAVILPHEAKQTQHKNICCASQYTFEQFSNTDSMTTKTGFGYHFSKTGQDRMVKIHYPIISDVFCVGWHQCCQMVYICIYTKFEKFGIFSKSSVYKFLIWYI